MDTQSDDITALLVDSATGFIEEHYGAKKPRFDIETPQAVDRTLWAEMAGLGWLGLALPESLGGLGLGMHGACALAEAMGRKAVPEPFVAAALLPSVLLARCDAADAVVQQVAAAIAGGETVVTLAWQEAAGEFVPALPATRYADGRITGRKCFVPALEDDGLLLVTARDGQETVLVAVAADAEGITIQRQAGGSMSLAQVSFAATPVQGNTVLLRGAAADAAVQVALEAGRVAVAAQLTGIAAGVLAKTVSYVNERVQFERPIGSFQTIQHRCVDYQIANMLAGAAWRHAQRAFDAAPSDTKTAAAISAAKSRAGEAAMQVCKGSVQMHGAMGFTEEGGVGVYLRAAMQLANWLGNGTAHRRRFLATA